MQRFLLTGFSLLVSGVMFSQNETDALRYSRTGFGGTARFSAMGGAFGALGGDMSILSINPAGLGFYHKNEITFTPSFYNQKVTSEYNGTTSDNSRFNFRFDNFGFVFAGSTENTEETGWQTVGMGIAYNRYSSFQSDVLMTGQNRTSLLDSWKRTAGGSGPYNLDPFNELLAWNTWLLNNAIGDTTQYTDTIPDGDLLRQEKTVTTRGGMGEWVFGVGANYSNKIYIGASIGIPQVRYEEVDRYTEEEVADTTSDFDYLEFNQNLTTTGRGFNFKVGVIYRPVDMVRIGFAFHSPAVLKLADEYSSDMTSVIGGTTRENESPDGSFNYSIRTPMRMIGSVAFVVGKMGLISADYELVDYSEARLKSSTYSFADENNNVRTKYKSANNIRLGGELRLSPFTVRGGFAWYGSPYASGVDNSAARLYFTGGAGYRDPDENFFVDLGIVTTNEKSNYYFYDQSVMGEPVHNKSSVVNVVLTLGFRY